MPVGSRVLVAAFDLERPSGLGMRPHVGVAMRLMPQFELRGGVSTGSVTAGSEFHYGGLAIDYAYRGPRDRSRCTGSASVSRPGSPCPRAGSPRVASRSGSSPGRLEENFQTHLDDQIASLVTRATSLRAAGDLDGAADLVASAMLLDPANSRRVASLAIGIQRDRAVSLERTNDFAGAALAYGRVLALAAADTAAIRRARAMQGREQPSRITTGRGGRTVSAAAFEAFAADDLPAARLGYQRAIAIDPDDAESERMLARTEDRIARRAQTLADQARGMIQAGIARGRDGAGGPARPARSLGRRRRRRCSPSFARPAPLRACRGGPPGSAGARRACGPRRAGEQPRRGPRPRPCRVANSRRSYRRGVQAMEQNRNEEAVRYWEIVWAADPAFASVAGYLEREYLTRGMEAFAAGRLPDAVEHWRRVLRIDPGNARAAAYVARAQQQISRTRQILGSER